MTTSSGEVPDAATSPSAEMPATAEPGVATTAVPSVFGTRIVTLLAARIAVFAVSVVTSVLISRLLGPEGRGAYYLVLLAPSTLFALAQLGIPSALVYFAGRGRSIIRLRGSAYRLGLALGVGAGLPTLLLLPVLEATALRSAPDLLLRVVLVALPLQFLGSFLASLLIGRQAIRWYSLVSLAQSIASLVLAIVLVGILGWGVTGAVVGSLLVGVSSVVVFAVLAERLPAEAREEPISMREIIGYGARAYPANVTAFFGYRADVYLLSWLLGAAGPIGLYSLAVTFAELVFYLPDSVSTVFFPRVASSDRREADRLVTAVSRTTLLITGLAAIALVPAAAAAIHVILPAFVDSLPALVVILPGVVALSLSKVLAGYVSGLGKPLPVGTISVISLTVNVAANLVLIPPWGIVGAAGSSLISYSLEGALMLALASRLAGAPLSDFVVPRRADVRLISTRLLGLLNELRTRAGPA